MKIARLIPFLVIPLLFACFPKKPEIPMTEVPAEPFLKALEQRERSFSTLKAFGSIQVVRKNRKRSFESVGILLNGREQFKIEAYGPLGETLITLVWNGKEAVLDMGGQRRVMPPGSSGLERIFGADVDPGELSAVLSGNIPANVEGSQAAFLCAPDGKCILELRRKDTLVRAHPAAGLDTTDFMVSSCEVYRGRTLVYQARFESLEKVSGYALPKRIIVENPDKRMSLTVVYDEAEVNVPLDIRSLSVPSQGVDQ